MPGSRTEMNNKIRKAYPLMRQRFGHQQWWPGDSPLEICIGAILTQNTNWTNVEKALQNLKDQRLLSLSALRRIPLDELARHLRPSGYFNLKAGRVKAFVESVADSFDSNLDRLFQGPTPEVRQRLLAIRGIGPETADSMLLYAGGHASFVIDAYTKRIFARHGWCAPDADYKELQSLCVSALSKRQGTGRLDYWRDYHAQLVQVGKSHCRPKNPNCEECPLRELLPSG